jgi:adenosylhomocysteine nucleosidase
MPDPAPLAFVCAMPMELRPLARKLGLRRETVGGVELSRGSLDGRPVVATVTGMGTALAGAGIRRLLDAVTPARVLVVGITGAVDDETVLGTVVRPARVIDAATGREHEHHPPDPGPTAGAMWTTDVITPADELPALRARGVVALDMETAAIAQACEAHGVPWSVVRAISDRATDGSVDDDVFHLARADGRPDPAAVARYLARHPARIPGLLRMGRDASLAARKAATAAIRSVAYLPGGSPPPPSGEPPPPGPPS